MPTYSKKDFERIAAAIGKHCGGSYVLVVDH